MNIISAILFAAASPLMAPTNYIFAPFGVPESNATAFIKGEIMGSGFDYRSIRAEDLAFMNEALAERMAVLNGSIGTIRSNSVSSLQMDLFEGFNFDFVPQGEKIYIASSGSLPPGTFICDYDAANTNRIGIRKLSQRNVTNDVRTWEGGVTNTYRADWPVTVTQAVTKAVSTTNYYDTAVLTNIMSGSWFYFVTKDIPTNEIFGIANLIASDNGVHSYIGISENIPWFSTVTNIYSEIGKTKFIVFSQDVSYSTSNIPIVITRYSHEGSVYDFDHSDKTWANITINPSPPTVSYVTGGIGGTIYELHGDAHKSREIASVWSESDYDYHPSVAPGDDSVTETRQFAEPQNDFSIDAKTFLDLNVLTTGGTHRISGVSAVYQPFSFSFLEIIEKTTPGETSNIVEKVLYHSGNIYALMKTSGSLDWGSDRLIVNSSISKASILSLFGLFSDESGIRYTTLNSISPQDLPSVPVVEYDDWPHSGRCILSVHHEMTIVNSQVIVLECNFTADVE